MMRFLAHVVHVAIIVINHPSDECMLTHISEYMTQFLGKWRERGDEKITKTTQDQTSSESVRAREKNFTKVTHFSQCTIQTHIKFEKNGKYTRI